MGHVAGVRDGRHRAAEESPLTQPRPCRVPHSCDRGSERTSLVRRGAARDAARTSAGSGRPWGDPASYAPYRSSTVREKPDATRSAATLMHVGAGVTLLNAVANVIDARGHVERRADRDPTSAELDAAVATGVGATVLGGLIVAGLWVWMAAVAAGPGHVRSWHVVSDRPRPTLPTQRRCHGVSTARRL